MSAWPHALNTAMPADPRLLADIGGTNARFAWQDGPGAPLQDVRTLATADHPSLEGALRSYLAQTGRSAPPRCAIGIANPVHGDQIKVTNNHWSFSISAVKVALGFAELVVINDFTALALALPHLQPHEVRVLPGGPQQAEAAQAIGVLGAGTGLGMGGLLPLKLPDGTLHWAPIEGEGGHITMAPETELEIGVLRFLQGQLQGRVSAERLLSGMGLENLCDAIAHVTGQAPRISERTAAAISQAGLSGQCPVCVQVLDTFCGLLGSVAGDLALLLGARGGIYIGGGIVPRLGAFFDRSTFRQRFDDKGRMSVVTRQVPVFIIDAAVSPALLGASQALR